MKNGEKIAILPALWYNSCEGCSHCSRDAVRFALKFEFQRNPYRGKEERIVFKAFGQKI
jgi:hypothetical protein